MVKNKIFFVSLGCPKNLVDSEIMLGILQSEGYGITDDPEKASVVAINTCGFIKDAKKESIDTILEYAQLKRGGLKTLIVSGCMVQRYKSELVKLLPEVDIFIGTNDYAKIFDYIDEHNAAKAGAGKVFHAADPTYVHTSGTPRILSAGQRSAYLKIAEGCQNRCTYCIIPKLRGDFRSRAPDDVVSEAKRLVKSGIIELNVIAQDVGSYGIDLVSGSDLAALLKRLSGIKRLKWLRLLYLHPRNVTDEVISIIAGEEKIVKYIDLPVQHISTRILKRMNRYQTGKEVRGVIAKIRKRIPDAALRTSLIVGFPGETVDDFNDLCDFVKEAQFDNLGVFEYSKEEGTAAYNMGGQVHHSTKRARYNKILKIQAGISRQKNAKYMGRTLPVLVEGVSEESEYIIKGRAAFQAADIDGCVYITDGEYKIGTVQDVCIYETHTYDLLGRVV